MSSQKVLEIYWSNGDYYVYRTGDGHQKDAQRRYNLSQKSKKLSQPSIQRIHLIVQI